MANSFLNIAAFLLTTAIYYFIIKKPLTYDIFSNQEEYKGYIKQNYTNLAIYLLLVIVIQFLVNASVITTKCGGSISENMGPAGIFTFIPWILIFGVIILILTIYPGFKSAFADVVGYFYVSGKANTVLTELLVDQKIQQKINEEATEQPEVMTEEKKEAMQSAADAIIKICGNTSILINQIVPSNFNEYWNILTPLMKTKFQQPGPETDEIKNSLFELVITRDTVGEAMWYIYTGLLLTSIVQLKITSTTCVNNPDTMEEKHQEYLAEEEKVAAATEKAESTEYTITG